MVYVDDSVSKQKIKNKKDVERHHKNINKIYNWEKKNNMEFNGKKFQALRYGEKSRLKEGDGGGQRFQNLEF